MVSFDVRDCYANIFDDVEPTGGHGFTIDIVCINMTYLYIVSRCLRRNVDEDETETWMSNSVLDTEAEVCER